MTILGCTGRIFDYVKVNLGTKAQQKKEEPAAPSGLSAFFKQHNEMKKTLTLENITNKMKFGKRLTKDEMEFLKIHNPEMYAKALKIEKEREEHRRDLRRCKTKEEAMNLHVSKAFQPKMDSDLKMALFDEFTEFVKSKEFDKLPSEHEKNEEEQDECQDERQGKRKLKKSKALQNYEMQRYEIKDAYLRMPNSQNDEASQ
ncbi:MAG: hypothetical protein FWC26_08015 [Fibromonadales bacterium]|nr:hypothetical protein [Fibromonadales bacterium]